MAKKGDKIKILGKVKNTGGKDRIIIVIGLADPTGMIVPGCEKGGQLDLATGAAIHIEGTFTISEDYPHNEIYAVCIGFHEE